MRLLLAAVAIVRSHIGLMVQTQWVVLPEYVQSLLKGLDGWHFYDVLGQLVPWLNGSVVKRVFSYIQTGPPSQ